MPEYKTNYYQMTALMDMIKEGWTIENVESYQGYMRIFLRREDETWQFDMESIN